MSKRHHRHLIIPDTQIRPGEPVHHLDWARAAILQYKPDVIVHLGDHWDMASLSSYDRAGSKSMEGKRYLKDVEVGNEAFERLNHRITTARYRPRKVILRGNHENRIERAIESDAKLDGALSMDHLDTLDWECYPFLERVWIHGIVYSHYFQQQNSPHAIGGSIDNRLNRIGDSFVQGHQQGFLYGNRVYPTGRTRHGLVAGSFYLHDEAYKGRQGNDHWRGIVVLNGVCNGDYAVMPLDVGYLRREYGRRK
jgi:hypothetical protein